MPNSLRSILKNIILGKKEFILSHKEYKRALLTGQLCIISFIASALYIIFDLTSGIYYAWPYQVFCSVMILISWWLNRQRKHRVGNLVLGFSINLTVFIFSSIEQVETGLYMFYVATSIGAFVVFGYEERMKAFAFAGLSVILFFVSLMVDFQLFPRLPHNEEYVRINLVFNFLICVTASVLMIYFLIKINYRSESILKDNENKIMIQNQELTKINNELDSFVYSTSHDLRAPLSSIQGLIHLSELTHDLPEVKNYVKMMQERIDHLDKFINDIADYSRNSRTEIVLNQIQLRKIIRESFDNLRFYPGSEKVRIELNVSDELFIYADATRLQMVLANLFSNAFKYRDTNKEDNFVKVSATSVQNQISISVEDNGIGISAEYVPRIFDMFFQAHEKSVGSGLGLYIVKETIQKMNGSITVKSEIRKGSCFTITLPGITQ